MYLIFDTETCGLPRDWKAPVSNLNNWPRVVQVAWLLCNEAYEVVAAEHQIVKPDGYSIPPDAARIHGITTERALAEGQPLGEVLDKFLRICAQAQFVIAHNASFDRCVLGAEFLRAKLDDPFVGCKIVCTKEASTDHCRLPGNYGYKWPTLAELHFVLFREEFQESHTAHGDALACARCFFELKRLGIIA